MVKLHKNHQWSPKSIPKSNSFNPNRAYIAEAVREYLKYGGKITRIELTDETYQAFLEAEKGRLAADQFLRGM